MNREDYQQVKEIFQAALDVAPDSLDSYLNEQCSDNAVIRQEVEKLLNSFETGYLEQPAIGKFADLMIGDQLEVGQEIGHYKIREKIGAGGMGEVYLADDTKLDRQVAIKILPKEFAEDAERMNRFVREAKSASALNHPNIITIHEISAEGDTHFIATEYIEGETLRSHLANQSASFKSMLEMAIQIASALDAAHHAGIIHRDIKPENVMIRPDGLVKILDFGIAKLSVASTLADASSKAATTVQTGTNPGMIIGTANYMSPEQAQGKKVDGRSDIFSFGIVLYEMLSGKRAFEGENAMDVISSILKDEPKPIHQLLPELPREIERIVGKMLRKNRDERYQTARGLLTDLKDAKQELEFQDKLERTTPPHREPPETQISPATTTNETQNQSTSSAEYIVKQVKHHKFIYLTIAVLLIAGIGFGIYRYSGSKKAEVSFESAKINRVTTSGKATIAGISPDGKYIVHAVDDAGKQSLWVRQILTGSNIQIVPPADISYWGITISPDGNFVYYVARDVGKGFGLLYRIPLLGGTPVPLVTDVDSPVAISPDGSQMAFVRWAADSTSRLFAANMDGTAERELTKRDKPETLVGGPGSGPAWSPDGRTVVCPLKTREADSLLSVRVSDGLTTPLTQNIWGVVGQVTWFDGDTLILIARDQDPNSAIQLWSLSLSDGQATPITRDLNDYRGVSLSADSNTLVTVQSNTQSNVFLAQAGDEEHSKELTTGKGKVMDFSWTADGRVLYDSTANGNWDIFSVKTDGTEQQLLTTDPNTDYYPIASGDGRYIVFSSRRAGLVELWRMSSDGKNPIQLTTGGGQRGSSITPDGKWLLYASSSDIPARIFKISIAGGEPEPVVDDRSVSFPVVSPDGQTIAYWSYTDIQNGNRNVLKIMPFSGGPAVKTFELPPTAAIKRIQFSANGQTIFYLDTRNGVSNIWSQPVGGGKPKQITNFKNGKIWSFAYSPDRKQLGFTKGETTSDVVMISGIKK